jgi:pyruvate formate lyase activating enzyme
MNKEQCFRGIQKTSVIDFPGKVACVLFAGGCNFRCPFCYNVTLVEKTAPELVWPGIWHFLDKRKHLLQGVVISGGEPTLAPYLKEFIVQAKGLGLSIKLDTNGSNPQVLGELLGKGLLDYVSMDIKNSPEKYAETCGLKVLDLVPLTESIRLLKECGTAYEFRTTLCAGLHTPEDFQAIAALTGGGERYILQRVQTSPTLSGRAFTPLSPREMEEMAKILQRSFNEVKVR